MVEHYLLEVPSGKLYRVVLAEPEAAKAISSRMAVKILKELSKPVCASDLAVKLNINEQNVYYHIRKLRKFGLLDLVRKEERGGAVAKIYRTKAGIVAIKLFDVDPEREVSERVEPGPLRPFISDGLLNAEIVIGSPEPHGKYRSPASDGFVAIALAMFLGSFLKEVKFPVYKLDTQVREVDLRGNLILVGGPKANMISDSVNDKMPARFEFSESRKEWLIRSQTRVHAGKRIGLIVRERNPFNPENMVLLLAGTGFRGSAAAVIGLQKYLDLLEDNRALIVAGLDSDADGIIDDCELVEAVR